MFLSKIFLPQAQSKKEDEDVRGEIKRTLTRKVSQLLTLSPLSFSYYIIIHMTQVDLQNIGSYMRVLLSVFNMVAVVFVEPKTNHLIISLYV